jgi:polar amino acid transport system substrate-binding protein
MKRACAAIVLALAVIGLAGCGSGSDRAERIALAALGTPAPTTTNGAPPPPPPPGGDATASLRPRGPLPAPGAMPAGSFMAKIKSRGYLLAGVDQNTLLFAYFNPLDHQHEGFEIDLLHELAKAIFGDPNALRFVAVTTAERIPAVQARTVDIVADAVTITCQRRQQVDFSTVYYDAGQKILVPANSTAHSVSDLAGRPVCVTRGSTSLERLKALPSPRPVPYPLPQRTDCLVALQRGLVDGVTSDDAILLGFKAQDPYTTIIGPSLADEPYGMAISKAHPEFVRFVNGVLEQVRTDGRWKAHADYWLGKLIRTPAAPLPHYSG